MVGRNGKCAVGIDIAFDAIRVAELEMKTSLRVQSISAHPVGLGAFGQDRSVNWAALESALREILQRYKLKGKRTHVAIPSAYTVIRQLSLPDFSDAELREVISFELTNSIHLPFPEVVFDFVRCPKGGDGGPDDGNCSVILIAADRIFVDELIKCLNGAGVRPVSIDVRPLAMYRVLRRLSTLPSTFLMTDVDATGTRIHVFHDGLLYLTRDVPIQLAGSADGMGFGEVGAAQERGESGELATAVPVESLTAAAYVERLGAELDRTLNFFRYTLNQRTAEFQETVFTGSRRIPMDVIDAISRLTGMKARMILFQDVLHENLISSRRGLMVSQEDTLTDYTAAIGLAMRGV